MAGERNSRKKAHPKSGGVQAEEKAYLPCDLDA